MIPGEDADGYREVDQPPPRESLQLEDGVEEQKWNQGDSEILAERRQRDQRSRQGQHCVVRCSQGADPQVDGEHPERQHQHVAHDREARHEEHGREDRRHRRHHRAAAELARQQVRSDGHGQGGEQEGEVQAPLAPSEHRRGERDVVGRQRRVLRHLGHRRIEPVPVDREPIRIGRGLPDLPRRPQKQRIVDVEGLADERQQENAQHHGERQARHSALPSGRMAGLVTFEIERREQVGEGLRRTRGHVI